MKIAITDPSLFTGRYDDSLCAALAQAGQEVHLLGRPLRATDAIVPRGYRYHPHFFRLSERLRGMIGEGRLARVAKGAEYLAQTGLAPLGLLTRMDVVHVQWLPLPGADRRLIERLAVLPNRPALVHTVHNSSAFHGETNVQARGYDALLARFDRLIVHGGEGARLLAARGIAQARIACVPHPPMALAPADAAALARVPDPVRPRLLFFGTIRPYKGFDLLIAACLKLWREGADFELAVAGKPFIDIAPDLDAVRAAGYAGNLIVDLGFLKESELDAHLRKADMIVFPYRDIDSSGAFLSALHYGKAMVASRVGMFAGLDTGNGQAPLALCAPDDADALAEALAPLIADREARARLGRGALALHRTLGGWAEAARATLGVYAGAQAERLI